MVLFKLIQSLFLPSGVFLFLLLLALFEKKRRRGFWLILVSILIYWVFSISPISYALISSLERKVLVPEGAKASTVVMLRGGGDADRLRAGGVLELVAQREIERVIVVGGSALNPMDSGAQNMKRYLVNRGVEAKKIITEGQSRNTFENALATKVMLGKEPFLLVTSAYHMPRSERAFKQNGMSPIPYPVDFKEKPSVSLMSIVPDPGDLRLSDMAIHEYLGMIYYGFR